MLQEPLHLSYRPQLAAIVNDRVTIWAHRAQISDRINHVLPPMSDSGRRWWTWINPANSGPNTASKSKPQTTHLVPRAALTLQDGLVTGFVGVHGHSPGRAFY